MSGFFKKTLGIFVEFENEEQGQKTTPIQTPVSFNTPAPSGKPVIGAEELDKFEKHFEKLFAQINLPGPDYFEFWKMMETLEAHIADEKARIAAVFASLAIQGLDKNKLVESAAQYRQAVEKDKFNFLSAVNNKANTDIESKKDNVTALEKRIAENSELIQKLTKEITEAQAKIGVIKKEITEEESRLVSNKNSYNVACEALLSKITSDIDKIQKTL